MAMVAAVVAAIVVSSSGVAEMNIPFLLMSSSSIFM